MNVCDQASPADFCNRVDIFADTYGVDPTLPEIIKLKHSAAVLSHDKRRWALRKINPNEDVSYNDRSDGRETMVIGHRVEGYVLEPWTIIDLLHPELSGEQLLIIADENGTKVYYTGQPTDVRILDGYISPGGLSADIMKYGYQTACAVIQHLTGMEVDPRMHYGRTDRLIASRTRHTNDWELDVATTAAVA